MYVDFKQKKTVKRRLFYFSRVWKRFFSISSRIALCPSPSLNALPAFPSSSVGWRGNCAARNVKGKPRPRQKVREVRSSLQSPPFAFLFPPPPPPPHSHYTTVPKTPLLVCILHLLRLLTPTGLKISRGGGSWKNSRCWRGEGESSLPKKSLYALFQKCSPLGGLFVG